jgi:site-specific DNA recombinase
LLRQIDIGEPALQLVLEGLKSSHMGQAKEHAEAIKRLQAEYDRIQSCIQAMYIDKLDAKVDPGMFEPLSADWRKQQNRCLREIERRQSADQHYLEEDVTILEMARNAQRLFDSGTDGEVYFRRRFIKRGTLRRSFCLAGQWAKPNKIAMASRQLW